MVHEPKLHYLLRELARLLGRLDLHIDLLIIVSSDGVDRDSGGESGHGARARRDTETKCWIGSKLYWCKEAIGGVWVAGRKCF